ncbi:MAG: gliding motility protein GldN [Bacteroidetes bacterium]|nr:MAG: gliding motility protein GldN [Bacteroidota bacterium]
MKSLLYVMTFFGFFIGISLSSNGQILDSPRDGIYDEISTPEKKPVQYSSVREADVAWKKRVWRTIDFRQKINHPFYYPETPQGNWKSFMRIVMDAIREGSITAYDPTGDDMFLVPYTYSEIEKKFSKEEEIIERDPDNPEIILSSRTDIVPFDPTSVEKIQLKEDWFFDKQRSVMDVRILGICPLVKQYDDNGNYLGTVEEMFWIYFPEARPVFAKAEVFNTKNGAERRTYDELFWKRIFGSYIYKEENVYDRPIYKYASGMDALLEAERIKNDLFSFEHELWEF